MLSRTLQQSSRKLRRGHRPLFTSNTAPFIHTSASARNSFAPTPNQSTVNHDEIAHFSRLSSLWWDERGEFALLHKMNPVRMQFIRDKLVEMKYEDGHTEFDEDAILEGLNILDVGCGGGLLSESLTRLGASTRGIDASSSNIAIASLHASKDPALSFHDPSEPTPLTNTLPRKGKGKLTYEHTSVEELLVAHGPASFDVVCSMEVVEHVDNPRGFLDSCSQLVKPGGHLFLSTVARTPLAYFLTIFAAEKLLGIVEPGTHTYSKYINPSELVSFFSEYRGRTPDAAQEAVRPWISKVIGDRPIRVEGEVRGMIYVPWNGEWTLAPRGQPWAEYCNYVFWVRRPFQ